MKKYKRVPIIILLFTIVLVISAGCSKKEEDFDASGYVNASLDAVFHEEYAEYAKFLDVSEKDNASNQLNIGKMEIQVHGEEVKIIKFHYHKAL